MRTIKPQEKPASSFFLCDKQSSPPVLQNNGGFGIYLYTRVVIF